MLLREFICSKSLTVVPHRVATFCTRTTFPLYLEKLTGELYTFGEESRERQVKLMASFARDV